jgi:hypothetical protein
MHLAMMVFAQAWRPMWIVAVEAARHVTCSSTARALLIASHANVDQKQLILKV